MTLKEKLTIEIEELQLKIYELRKKFKEKESVLIKKLEVKNELNKM